MRLLNLQIGYRIDELLPSNQDLEQGEYYGKLKNF